MGRPSSAADRWSALHHDIDPTGVPLLPRWLSAMWWLAGPLARRGVRPSAVTAAGLVFAVGAVAVAGPLPWAAALLVLSSVVCDGLDGAIAVVADRATTGGARADALADRIADLAFAAVIWRCGAPWWLALIAGVLAVAVDGGRRMRHLPDRITVAERPSWTVCAVVACASAAVSGTAWPPIVCAAIWIGLGTIGLGQLSRAGRAQIEAVP